MHFEQEAESGGKIFSGMAEAHSSSTIKVQEACFAAGDRATPLFPAEVSKSSALPIKGLWKIRVPIRVKLSPAITSIIFLTIMVLRFTIFVHQREQLYSQTVHTGKVSLNYFAANANIPFLNDDIVRFNRLIKDAASVKGILYAAVVDRKNLIKAHSDPKKIGKPLQDFQAAGPRGSRS